MTVRELIELLAVVDQDQQVELYDCSRSDRYQRIGAVTVEENKVVLLGD